jgi:hypothetical protein
MQRPDPETGPGVLVDGHLHSDSDAICPRCLSWIEGRDYVRQNIYGLLQHEVCPPLAS